MNGLERFDLHGKTALVTGGGSGLGRAISIGLAQSGAVVVLVDKNLATAEETLAEIERQG